MDEYMNETQFEQYFTDALVSFKRFIHESSIIHPLKLHMDEC
jgi:hypothetical protein